MAVVVLLLGNLAGPASAGYREGRISCQNGWVVATISTATFSTWHEHYLEPNDTVTRFTGTLLAIWDGSRNYGTWSVESTPMSSGYGFCTQF